MEITEFIKWSEFDIQRGYNIPRDEFDQYGLLQFRGTNEGFESPIICSFGYEDGELNEDTNTVLFAADFDYVVTNFHDHNVYTA